MTNNPTIDGVLVPRESLEKFRRILSIYAPGDEDSPEDAAVAELHALLDAPAVERQEPDAGLCKFYEVEDYPGLVRELVGHVAQLQDSARRNVKPWEDTFPPTLLPAHIERVSAANASATREKRWEAAVEIAGYLAPGRSDNWVNSLAQALLVLTGHDTAAAPNTPQ